MLLLSDLFPCAFVALPDDLASSRSAFCGNRGRGRREDGERNRPSMSTPRRSRNSDLRFTEHDCVERPFVVYIHFRFAIFPFASPLPSGMGNKTGKFASGSAYGPLGPMRKGALIESLLKVIQDDLVRLAAEAAEQSDAFYSVAILNKTDLSLVACGRDKTKTKDPTATAELNAIQAFFSLAPDTRPPPADCIFLCVHEPSALALYQIAQSGFDNFVFLFSHAESRAFGAEMPFVKLTEIFTGTTENEEYNVENAYWTAFALGELIQKEDKKEEHLETVEAIKTRFKEMTETAAGLEAPETPSKQAANA